MSRYASPSLVVSIVALIVALGGAGYSATGGNFILGKSNTATTSSRLTADINGRTLALRNRNAGSAATPLALIAAAGHPPFTVNTATKVRNLNADRLDSLDSTQFPRKTVISFNLAAGATSAPITVPANRPVFVMGVTTTTAEQGVGQVTLLRTPINLIWIGLEGPLAPAITSGVNNAQGVHIVYLDVDHTVDIEVNDDDSIRIHNGDTGQRAGKVTLIW